MSRKRLSLLWAVLPVVLTALAPLVAEARPEYAINNAMNRCTTCHLSPSGGGTRNVTGKAFGYRGFQPGPFATQDLMSADVRMIHFQPEDADENNGGFALMSAEVGANIPIVELTEEQSEVRLVAAHNIGGFTGASGVSKRPTFLRFMRYADGDTGILPQYFLLGRFVAPFGIVTDEHRTYTRMQSGSTWYDVEAGVMMSSNVTENLHYDLSLVNGENSAGSFGQGRALAWGTVFNLRFMPAFMPIALGVSASYHERKGDNSPAAEATSLYGMFSFGRITNGAFRLTILAEAVLADNWNANMSSHRFVSDSTYLDDPVTEAAQSQGYYGKVSWEITDRFTLEYKYDQLQLNNDFPADAYERHGVGFKYFFGPNLFTNFRVEKSETGHPSEEAPTQPKQGTLDAAWLYFQVSI